MSKNTDYTLFTKPTCPWGKKAIELLHKQHKSFRVLYLNTEEEVVAFKEEHKVETTPQIFRQESRIGGYTDLAKKLGEDVDSSPKPKSYRPVIAVFSVAALMAIATSQWIVGFMGFSLCILAILKLMDPEAFQKSFQKYDIVTKRFPPYSHAYPYLELLAGIGFLSGFLPTLTGLVSFLVGSVGTYSVYKSVYTEKKDLECACVGGSKNVPLGPVSLTENLVMAVMGLFLLI